MNVVTRFAPSPTGYLHIGSARVALFNYLFAKRHKGKFLLRIEDTDRARSKDEYTHALIEAMNWLDIKPDGEPVSQYANANRHVEVARELVAKGKAYYCFTPQEEVNKLRDEVKAKGESFIFHSPWRDKTEQDYPQDHQPVIRLKAPREGSTVIEDKVQGRVEVANDHIDDMVLLRADGAPTYMLAVVVDDHDMGVTHVFRGDDHLNNAFKQQIIYEAMSWDVPIFAHMPLIHGQDGAKLSKRHGAVGAEQYRDMGYLSEAVNNYLLRLGWSHGDDEIISRQQAIEWFDLEHVGKAPARLDFAKLENLNAHYIKNIDEEILYQRLMATMEAKYPLNDDSKNFIRQSLPSIKTRAKLLNELAGLAEIFIVPDMIEFSQDAKDIISDIDDKFLAEIKDLISGIADFSSENIQAQLKEYAAANNMKLGELMKPLRALITGKTTSPSVFEIMAILGKDNIIRRLHG